MYKLCLFSLTFLVVIALILGSSFKVAFCDDYDLLFPFPELNGAAIVWFCQLPPRDIVICRVEGSDESSHSSLKQFTLYLERQEKSPPR